MAEDDIFTYVLATFLHARQHKSKKIAMCASDLQLAQEIVALLRANGIVKDDA